MHIRLEVESKITNYPGPLRSIKDISSTRIQKLPHKKDIEGKGAALKTKLEEKSAWIKDTVKYLKQESGEGWGIEVADVILDDQIHLYYTQDHCQTCNAKGVIGCTQCNSTGAIACVPCHGIGQEPCMHCNGTGRNTTQPDQYCAYCHGSTQMPCRYCRGTRRAGCPTCQSKGNLVCYTCNGAMTFISEEIIIPTVRSFFKLDDTTDFPTGFRRALARSGLKTLAKGHAKITMLDADESDKNNIIIPYLAETVFTDMRMRVNGKAFRGSVMGLKEIILDIPSFIDDALAPHIAKFEMEAAAPSTLTKALEFKVIRQAFELMQSNIRDVKKLRAHYPAGLSADMAQRLMSLIQKLLSEQTKQARFIAGMVILAIFGCISALIFKFDLRMLIAEATKPIATLAFDIFMCGMAWWSQHMALRYAAAREVRSRLSHKKDAPALPIDLSAQKSGRLGLVMTLCSAILYFALMLVMGAAPHLGSILMRPLG